MDRVSDQLYTATVRARRRLLSPRVLRPGWPAAGRWSTRPFLPLTRAGGRQGQVRPAGHGAHGLPRVRPAARLFQKGERKGLPWVCGLPSSRPFLPPCMRLHPTRVLVRALCAHTQLCRLQDEDVRALVTAVHLYDTQQEGQVRARVVLHTDGLPSTGRRCAQTQAWRTSPRPLRPAGVVPGDPGGSARCGLRLRQGHARTRLWRLRGRRAQGRRHGARRQRGGAGRRRLRVVAGRPERWRQQGGRRGAPLGVGAAGVQVRGAAVPGGGDGRCRARKRV